MSTVELIQSARVGPESNGILMSPEEFDEIEDYDDDYVYELIHGVLVVNPIPSRAERISNDWLGHQFLTYQESHPNGHLIDDTVQEEYIRTATGRRRADRVVWVGLGRLPTDLDVPSIAIEFVSPGKRSAVRDYEEKRKEYLAAGVQEYWIIDRFKLMMTVFRWENGKEHVEVLAEHDVYEPKLLPGFEMPVGEVIERANRYGAQ